MEGTGGGKDAREWRAYCGGKRKNRERTMLLQHPLLLLLLRQSDAIGKEVGDTVLPTRALLSCAARLAQLKQLVGLVLNSLQLQVTDVSVEFVAEQGGFKEVSGVSGVGGSEMKSDMTAESDIGTTGIAGSATRPICIGLALKQVSESRLQQSERQR